MWINFGDGFLLVFAINNKESFNFPKDKYEQIFKGKYVDKYPILLVGNKQDLNNERLVTYEEAKALANSWGIKYIEVSSKTNFNCNEIF